MGSLERTLVRKEGQAKEATKKYVVSKGDSALTLTVADLLAGFIYGVVTADRAYTTPTAAAIIAAMGDEWEVGDTFEFSLVGTGGAITLTGGIGVTVTGGVMVDGVGARCVVTKSSATAVTIHCF